MDIREERDLIFDENYKCKSNDIHEVISFCERVTEKAKIQICTPKGQMYEYLPNVCRSVVKSIEM